VNGALTEWPVHPLLIPRVPIFAANLDDKRLPRCLVHSAGVTEHFGPQPPEDLRDPPDPDDEAEAVESLEDLFGGVEDLPASPS